MVSSREEPAAMVRITAGFGDRGDNDRAFLLFRAEVGGQDLELLQEIGVRVHRRITVTTRV